MALPWGLSPGQVEGLVRMGRGMLVQLGTGWASLSMSSRVFSGGLYSWAGLGFLTAWGDLRADCAPGSPELPPPSPPVRKTPSHLAA